MEHLEQGLEIFGGESGMRFRESLVVFYNFTVFSNHSEGLHND